MNGEFVRFFHNQVTGATPVAMTLYTASGAVRTLAVREFFYMTDLMLVGPPIGGTSYIFDDIYGDQSRDIGNTLFTIVTAAPVHHSEFLELPARFSVAPYVLANFSPAGFFKLIGHGLITGA